MILDGRMVADYRNDKLKKQIEWEIGWNQNKQNGKNV